VGLLLRLLVGLPVGSLVGLLLGVLEGGSIVMQFRFFKPGVFLVHPGGFNFKIRSALSCPALCKKENADTRQSVGLFFGV
jgi:hypothetical protein